MSHTSAYLRAPHYLHLGADGRIASTIATVISDNGKVQAPGDHRFIEKPEYRNVIKLRRNSSREHLYFYQIIVVEPWSQRKASYELIATESKGCFLRYYGMRPRLLTHFGLPTLADEAYEAMSSNYAMASFLALREEIMNAHIL